MTERQVSLLIGRLFIAETNTKMLTRTALAIAILAVSATATSVPIIKSPLDMPARADPRVADSRLIGVAAIDKENRAFAAVGPWGKIIVSRDAGKTWRQSSVPVSSDLVAVHFPTPLNGWAVGHDGVVLHSADGGKSWERQLDGRAYGDIMVRYYEKLVMKGGNANAMRALGDARRFKADGADKPFLDVWFENEHSGWVVGAFNLILKTSDGGKNWEPWIDRTENEKASTLFAIRNAGDEVFIVGELGLVQRLDREKGRFVLVKTPYPGSFFGMAGKPGVVVIYGLRGNAYHSRDAGKTWRKLETGTSAGITGGKFMKDGRLVLVTGAGQMIVSANEGDSFFKPALSQSMPFNDLAPIDADTVVLVGDRGVHVEKLPGNRDDNSSERKSLR